MRRRVGLLSALLGGVACVLLAGMPGCDRTPAAATRPATEPVAVTTAPVSRRSVERSIEVVGTLYAEESALISSKVPGRAIRVRGDVGDRINGGSVLVELNRTDYLLAVEQRERALSESLARLNLSAVPAGEIDVESLPTVQKAKLQEQNALAKYQRGEKLFASSPPLLSEQDFADLKTAWQVAKSNYDAEVLAARMVSAEVATRVTELNIARQRLEDATVKAPMRLATDSPAGAGAATVPATGPATMPGGPGGAVFVVSKRLVSPGEFLREGSPVMELISVENVKLKAAVPERFVGQIAVGQKVRLTVEAYDEGFVGVVSRVSPVVEVESRTYQIEALVPALDGRLKPGLFARARVVTGEEAGVVFVPEAAVVSFAGVNRVFGVREGKAVEYRIVTGMKSGGWVEVVSGYKGEGGGLVVSNAGKLSRGWPVVVGAGPATRPGR